GCIPSAVNNDDLVVGHFGGACIIRGGTFVDLNTVLPPAYGWTLESAIAVSDAGHIAARGYNAEGNLHAFLLSPNAPTSMTSTTTTPSNTTTTTTLACATARCMLDAARTSSACVGQTIPGTVTAKLIKAESLIDHAVTTPRKARKLFAKA